MGDDGCPFFPTRRPPWRRTLVAQTALCLALYAAFNIGTPQTPGKLGRETLDLYFLSVRGGVWPAQQQIQLLQQMEKTVKMHKAKFVVNIGDRGEEDPLMRNATLHFPLLNIPWYATTFLHGQVAGNFLKNIKIPHDQALDIIGTDTATFQDSLHTGQLSEAGIDQLAGMQKMLEVTDSNWRIVVGFDPLIACEQDNGEGAIKFYDPLRNIFSEYGVNAYLSRKGCGGYHYSEGGFIHLGHPAPMDDKYISHRINGSHEAFRELRAGFLLHRVSPLEIESYYIDIEGAVVFKTAVQQRGKDDM